MKTSSVKIIRFWQRHPVGYSVFGLLVAVYALFVVLFTAAHGVDKLGNALALPVSGVLFSVMICLFPVWAGHHAFNWVLAIMMAMFLAYNITSARRRFPAKVWLTGLILVPAVNCLLNLLFARFGG